MIYIGSASFYLLGITDSYRDIDILLERGEYTDWDFRIVNGLHFPTPELEARYSGYDVKVMPQAEPYVIEEQGIKVQHPLVNMAFKLMYARRFGVKHQWDLQRMMDNPKIGALLALLFNGTVPPYPDILTEIETRLSAAPMHYFDKAAQLISTGDHDNYTIDPQRLEQLLCKNVIS